MVRSLSIILTLALSSLCETDAAWQVSLSSVFEYDHTIAEDDLPVGISRVPKPPFVLTGPLYTVETFANTSVRRARGNGVECRIDYAHEIGNSLRLFGGFSLTLLQQRITYDISYWNQYYGFNPFTFGIGGPPILIGRADGTVESFQYVPQVVVGASYAATERLSIALELSVGEAYVTYENYDFYNRVYQIARVIPPDQQESLRSTEDDWIGRQSIALAIEYQLSDHWSLNLSQAFVRNENYQLTNWAESNASIHGMTIRIQDQTQLQTALGVTYQF
jgi:hypothetical protein